MGPNNTRHVCPRVFALHAFPWPLGRIRTIWLCNFQEHCANQIFKCWNLTFILCPDSESWPVGETSCWDSSYVTKAMRVSLQAAITQRLPFPETVLQEGTQWGRNSVLMPVLCQGTGLHGKSSKGRWVLRMFKGGKQQGLAKWEWEEDAF